MRVGKRLNQPQITKKTTTCPDCPDCARRGKFRPMRVAFVRTVGNWQDTVYQCTCGARFAKCEQVQLITVSQSVAAKCPCKNLTKPDIFNGQVGVPA